MDLPSPRHMELREWADAMTYVLSLYSNIRGIEEDDWQAWGTLFCSSPSLSRFTPPNPYQYDDWVLWGEHLIDSISNADHPKAHT